MIILFRHSNTCTFCAMMMSTMRPWWSIAPRRIVTRNKVFYQVRVIKLNSHVELGYYY